MSVLLFQHSVLSPVLVEHVTPEQSRYLLRDPVLVRFAREGWVSAQSRDVKFDEELIKLFVHLRVENDLGF